MPDQALDFLRFLTCENDPVATFVTMRNGSPGKPMYNQRYTGVANTLGALSRTGSDIYFTVNQTDGQGRRAENVTHARAYWADYDHGVPSSWPIKPSRIVQSSPGKAQCYWVLDFPRAPDAHWAGINRAIAIATGGDQNACDAARVLRLPGFVNHKYPDKPVVQLLPHRDFVVSQYWMEHYWPPIQVPRSATAMRGSQLDEAEKLRRYGAWLSKAGKPPAPGTGLRSWLFAKAAAGVRDFALSSATVADRLITLDHDVDRLLIEKIAQDAERYGQKPLGAALAERKPGAVKME